MFRIYVTMIVTSVFFLTGLSVAAHADFSFAFRVKN
jgi:hypothetical protein